MPFYVDSPGNRKLNRVGKEYGGGSSGGGAPVGNKNALKNKIGPAPKPKEPKKTKMGEPKKKPGPKPALGPAPKEPKKKPGPVPKPKKPQGNPAFVKTSAESKMETQINLVQKEWLKLIKTGVMQGISKKNLVPSVLKELLENEDKDINMPSKFIS